MGTETKQNKQSCDVACSPSDFYQGGKCDKNGCYKSSPRIYISGKITGMEAAAALQFAAKEQELRSIGWRDIINPMTLPHRHDKQWASYMRECIVALCGCTHIYMMRNWHKSHGAQIEHNLAYNLGLEIEYEKNPEIE